MIRRTLLILLAVGFMVEGYGQHLDGDAPFRSVPLQNRITEVQPMTGIALWEPLGNTDTDAIQLEFSYLRYSDVVMAEGVYDWTIVDTKLAAIAGRRHQGVLRFWDTYPGRDSGVPAHIRALPGYNHGVEKSEGNDTGFPDWSHTGFQNFILEFFERLAHRYDSDPRLAFLEVGFGLWSEYHIYDPEERLGDNFPTKAFQSRYFRHLDSLFVHTPWMISKDAHVAARTPFASDRELLDLQFGIFDDSFHLAWRPGYNLDGWEFFGRDRFLRSPMGGEILFPDKDRSDRVLAGWTEQTRNFGITFMITEQWLRWVDMATIKELSMACGYRFRITRFEADETRSRVTVANSGVAPIYYDAYVAVNGVRAQGSLIYLPPGESRDFEIATGGTRPTLTIECDRLVPGQRIGFEADIAGE